MYDLHTHSDFSDGTLPPEKLIKAASETGLRLIALTDHDTTKGLYRARTRAYELGMGFLNGVEIEAEYEDQLHILGLGVDPWSSKLRGMLLLQDRRRDERNERVIELLSRDGMYIRGHIAPTNGTITRANLAAAMVSAGYCSSISEAFGVYLGRKAPYYVPQLHPSMPEVLEAIHLAGGVSVLAHPMNMRVDHRALIDSMKANGLWGVEAHYGSATEEQKEYFSSLAKEFGLHITCGSDFHGENRPGITLGCSWRDIPELNGSEEELIARFMPGQAPAGRITEVRSPAEPPAPQTDAPAMPVRPRRRTLSFEEYSEIADRIASELPEDFFKGLTGGIVVSEIAKHHKKSLPRRPLYVLGEYHYGGNEGRYITLYYGSFRVVHGNLTGAAAEEEIRKVLLHEFRHHLETRAGQHDLEYEDDAYIEEYTANAAGNGRADLGLGED